MPLLTPTLPPIDPADFPRLPVRDRVRLLTRHWVEYGFGTPQIIPMLYLFKIAFLYVGLGCFIIAHSSGFGSVWRLADYWREPIFYQKAIAWTMLLEALNLGGSWGPLAGKFKPMMGGILFWSRPGTIRLRPWSWVPGTAGDTRSWFDVALYFGFIGSLITALALPGVVTPSLHAALPDNVTGLIARAPTLAAAVLIVLIGLRDKTIALASRIEQYLPALVFFVALPFRDMVIALKLLVVVVWLGAGISKFGSHFPNVLPPMISNAPYWPPRWLKLSLYRSFPDDLRPSRLTTLMAHGPASFGEIIPPLILITSSNDSVTFACALFMAGYHLFIFSTFPMAVPLEWNVLFGSAAMILFIGFPASHGYTVVEFSSTPLLVGIVCALLAMPVLGNLRPDLVSFLPSMRQYAGNWAAAIWAIKPEAEHKLDRVCRPIRGQVDQLVAMGYEPAVAELLFNMGFAFRTMHSQGRGLLSVLMHAVPDLDQRSMREGESMCNALLGFNFGDGHMHDERMIAAVQRQAKFEPGELIVAWVESQPIHRNYQCYKLIDAALGVIERGTFRVADAVKEQPWLPNGPIPLTAEWTSGDTLSEAPAAPLVASVARS